jgi:hypothetical protein
MSVKEYARALGGEAVSGNQVICPGPGHSPRDRSLSVKFLPGAADGFIVYSFAGDDILACRDHVRRLLGMPGWRADKEPRQAIVRPASIIKDEPDRVETIRLALRIWNESTAIIGTLAAVYLGTRRINLTPDIIEADALRFHPQCRRDANGRAVYGPAMIALMRDIRTDEPCGIQRTFLKPDGSDRLREIPGGGRLMLGRFMGAAIKLTRDEDVTTCLGIGEGVETTLSMRAIPEFGHSPIWAAGNAGRLKEFPVLTSVETLWIAIDNDPGGIEAYKALEGRWLAAGKEVGWIKPKAPGADVNDLLRRSANG